MLRKVVPFVAAIAALAVIAAPAAAQGPPTKIEDADASAECHGGFSGLGLKRVEIRAEGRTYTADTGEPREHSWDPYYYLQSTVKLKELYGDTWKRVPTKKVRGPGQNEYYLDTVQDSDAFPVLKRKYPRRKLTGKNRLRAVKGTATLESRRFSDGALLKTSGPLRFRKRLLSSSPVPPPYDCEAFDF
jgi:hypothetical protein